MKENPAVLFGNSFLSYLLVFVIFVVVAAVAVIIGITIAKKLEQKKLNAQLEEGGEEENSETPIEIA